MAWDLSDIAWQGLIFNLFGALVISLFGIFVYRLLDRGLRLAVERGRLSLPLTTALRLISRWTVIAVVLLLVLQQFGIWQNVWAALAAALALIGVGFVAVWSVLSNTLCTLLLLFVQPFHIGDEIEIPAEGLKGKAVDINLMFTTLADAEGGFILVPNNIFFQKSLRRRPGAHPVALRDQLSRPQPEE